MASDEDSDDQPLRQTQRKRKAKQQQQPKQQRQAHHRPIHPASTEPPRNDSRPPLMGHQGPVNEALVVLPIPNYGYLVQSPQSIISVPYHMMPEQDAVSRNSQQPLFNSQPHSPASAPFCQTEQRFLSYQSVLQQPAYHPYSGHMYQETPSQVQIPPRDRRQSYPRSAAQNWNTNAQGNAYGAYVQAPPPQQIRHPAGRQMPFLPPDGISK
ncbi:hypothetical protein FDECE_1043 [Fusarium decemcellulare]|nr:hypothetical protein FDECE_1043 [Fusarium decemcellulare]